MLAHSDGRQDSLLHRTHFFPVKHNYCAKWNQYSLLNCIKAQITSVLYSSQDFTKKCLKQESSMLKLISIFPSLWTKQPKHPSPLTILRWPPQPFCLIQKMLGHILLPSQKYPEAIFIILSDCYKSKAEKIFIFCWESGIRTQVWTEKWSYLNLQIYTLIYLLQSPSNGGVQENTVWYATILATPWKIEGNNLNSGTDIILIKAKLDCRICKVITAEEKTDPSTLYTIE